jgi:hypothetical protein
VSNSPSIKVGDGNIKTTKYIPNDSIKSFNFPFLLSHDDKMEENINNAFKAIKTGLNEVPTAVKENKADSLKFAAEKRRLAYSALPGYKVLSPSLTASNLPNYISWKKPFKDKPSLLITWSYKWCPPCLKIIDSLLNLGLAKKYNLILVNRDAEIVKETTPKYYISYADLSAALANRKPDYNQDALLFYDRSNELDDIDNSSTPLFIWLDNKMNIITTFHGYRINTSTITGILDDIEKERLVYSNTRYFAANGLPSKPEDAATKTIVTIPKSNLRRLYIYDLTGKEPAYHINYVFLDGYLHYRKSE